MPSSKVEDAYGECSANGEGSGSEALLAALPATIPLASITAARAARKPRIAAAGIDVWASMRAQTPGSSPPRFCGGRVRAGREQRFEIILHSFRTPPRSINYPPRFDFPQEVALR
jgi:hypothetical protein